MFNTIRLSNINSDLSYILSLAMVTDMSNKNFIINMRKTN